MSQATLPLEPQPRTETSAESERDIIFTANGSRKASEAIFRVGALIGMESLNTRPPAEIPVEFVDWPWMKLADHGGNVETVFERHLWVVADEQPRYAVAPDVMGDLHLPAALDYADELQQYAETVIVVPKSVHPSRVPEEFRVGMPCQDRYGGTPWQWSEYQDCAEVHLLGGSPVKHHEIVKHFINVESVDTSVPIKPAQFGDIWSEHRLKWTPTEGDFYWCLKETYRQMRQSMNPDRAVWDPRCRNRWFDYKRAFAASDDADLWGPGEEPPFPGREAI